LRTAHLVICFTAVQADFVTGVLGELDYFSALIGRRPSRRRFEVLRDIELNRFRHNPPPLCRFLTYSFVSVAHAFAKGNARAKHIDL
jgi:hypothetical protein